MNLRTGNHNIRLSHGVKAGDFVSGLASTWIVNTPGNVTLDLQSITSPADLTVNSQARAVIARGPWRTVTAVGTPNQITRIEGRCDGQIDVTGPADLALSGGASATSVKIRGTGVRGVISRASQGALPIFDFIAAIECSIDAGVTSVLGAGKVYAFDASSHNNILKIIGSRDAAFTTPSTDAGTLNRVITEAGDSYVDGRPFAGIDEGLLLMGWYA